MHAIAKLLRNGVTVTGFAVFEDFVHEARR